MAAMYQALSLSRWLRMMVEFSAVGLLLLGHDYSRTKQAVAQSVP